MKRVIKVTGIVVFFGILVLYAGSHLVGVTEEVPLSENPVTDQAEDTGQGESFHIQRLIMMPASASNAEAEYLPSIDVLNFANYYQKDADGKACEISYADSILEELAELDDQWMRDIYSLYDSQPEMLIQEDQKSELYGYYDPRDALHDPYDPTTWQIHKFHNIQMNITDGDGKPISVRSNSKDIMSMADIYTFYEGVDDYDLFLSYINFLWEGSHAYSYEISSVYYCSGCLQEEEEEGDLLWEEGTCSDIPEESASEYVILAAASASDAVMADQESEGPAGRNTTVQQEEIVSKAETTVHQEETVSEEETALQQEEVAPEAETALHQEEAVSEAETTAQQEETVSEAETDAQQEEIVSEAETAVHQEEAVSEAETAVQQDETGPETESCAQQEESSAEAAQDMSSAAENVPQSGDGDTLTFSYDPATSSNVFVLGCENPAEAMEESCVNQESSTCPGHVDLIIHMKILGLGEEHGLYELSDSFEKETSEEVSWNGWNDENRERVLDLFRQDWEETYGLTIPKIRLRNTLTNAEIEEYLQMLPDDLSEIRRSLIVCALSSVGRIPYYFGGKPVSPGYEENCFGSGTVPDEKGRSRRGLDCSGWINWVYWTALGKHLTFQSTSGLISLGREIEPEQLQPGDLALRSGKDAHVIMFLGWMEDGSMLVVHESSLGEGNVMVTTTTLPRWQYYRSLLD